MFNNDICITVEDPQTQEEFEEIYERFLAVGYRVKDDSNHTLYKKYDDKMITVCLKVK